MNCNYKKSVLHNEKEIIEMSNMFELPSTSIKIFIPIALLTLLHIGNIRAEEVYLTYRCSDTANYTSGSSFQDNLNLLLSSLASNGSRDGYFNTSVGVSPDVVYGHAQCRGDLSMEACRNCLNSATLNITLECPKGMDASLVYDGCLVRYSNIRFFSDYGSSSSMNPWQSGWYVPEDEGVPFSQSLEVLMTNLTKTAILTKSRYSYGDTDYKPNKILYGVVQCTQDLSPNDCETCLQEMISRIPTCCDKNKGVTYYSNTCYLRYQITPFLEGSSKYPPVHISSIQPQPRNTATATATATGTGGGKSNRIVIVVPILFATVAILGICGYFLYKKRRKSLSSPTSNAYSGKIEESPQTDSGPPTSKSESSPASLLPPYAPRRNGASSIRSEPSPKFQLNTIKQATEDFKENNKLGEGGFGAVYEGVLPDGKKIAVKRLLSEYSKQGLAQLENEINVLRNLHHQNLVALLGYCVDGGETLVIYEYVKNKSLDKHIFDPEKKSSLNWETRYKIIKGIARGLLYLHRDSRLRILHRDLKAGNILLDENMVAKIGDFGTARVFTVDQIHAKMTSVVGTKGHMAWEYLKESKFTEKSDVFSFGILVLEIISGQDVNGNTADLASNAYNLWEAGTSIQLMDPVLKGSSTSEVERCIHIGLLCVQHEPNARPDMSEVDIMLGSNNELNNPLKPTTLRL